MKKMGLVDTLLGGKEGEGDLPFGIKTSFRPFRLSAHRNEKVDLILVISNPGGKSKLASLTVAVSNGLGLNSTGLKRTDEMRVGEIGPGEEKEITIEIYGSSQTKEGNYRIGVVVYEHYRDYQHVINSVKKIVELRAE